MAGARGPLKLPKHLKAVPLDTDRVESAAELVPALAPHKPEAVAEDPELSKLWDDIVPQLDQAGLITVSDGPAVELTLRHFQLARRASSAVGKNITVKDHHNGGTLKKNPAEAVFRAESEMFLKYAMQLGMTFVSRARTPATRGGEDDGDNPFSAPAGN